MKQSEHDPTLKEHFTEDEARMWIRHLEKIIESLEKKAKASAERSAQQSEKAKYYRDKIKRLEARIDFLEEQRVKDV